MTSANWLESLIATEVTVSKLYDSIHSTSKIPIEIYNPSSCQAQSGTWAPRAKISF